MENGIKIWALAQVTSKEGCRDWSQLPSSFERDAARFLFRTIRPHFTKSDIKQRIFASKAVTFSEIKTAILATT